MVERMVALQVVDLALYEVYREKMLPILNSYGGSFRVDVRVSDVLLPTESPPFNRVFIMQFPSDTALEEFFADAEYRVVREQYFSPSVSNYQQLACYRVTSQPTSNENP